MKRYIVDGNVIDTRNVVGFAGERLFVEFDDHAALLRAVAEEVGKLMCRDDCDCHWCAECECSYQHHGEMLHDFEPSPCNCPRGRALVLLEVKP